MIQVIIESDKITNYQQDCFTELIKFYPSLFAMAKSEFEFELQEKYPNFEIIDFEKEFTLQSIEITREENIETSLNFDCILIKIFDLRNTNISR